MSMTQEEVTKRLKALKARCERLIVSSSAGNPEEWRKDAEAIDMAITALRPVSREVVERIWPGCDYCKHAWMEGLDLKPCASGNIGVELTIGRTSKDDAFGILAYYRNAAAGYIDLPFCPFCGRPMTDEAVQIVMER